jgi:hypothetical protein
MSTQNTLFRHVIDLAKFCSELDRLQPLGALSRRVGIPGQGTQELRKYPGVLTWANNRKRLSSCQRLRVERYGPGNPFALSPAERSMRKKVNQRKQV